MRSGLQPCGPVPCVQSPVLSPPPPPCPACTRALGGGRRVRGRRETSSYRLTLTRELKGSLSLFDYMVPLIRLTGHTHRDRKPGLTSLSSCESQQSSQASLLLQTTQASTVAAVLCAAYPHTARIPTRRLTKLGRSGSTERGRFQGCGESLPLFTRVKAPMFPTKVQATGQR